MDLGTSSNEIKVSFKYKFASEVYFRSNKFSVRILNAFVKPSEPCSMEQRGARVSEFAGYPLPSDFLWYFPSKNSESGVFCCRSQIHEIVKAW